MFKIGFLVDYGVCKGKKVGGGFCIMVVNK